MNTPLTKREEEVAKLVWEEYSTKKIAELLHIEESTAENHLGNIFAKLGVRSRVGLVKKLIEIGLVSP